ncbi:MAG: TylF/MycF/NovP-related O-methyltransferase, partial [Acetobacteraceae bacterium]
YILDTFEGFHPNDLKGLDAAAKTEAFSDTSLAAVRDLVGDESTKFIQGHFPETASQLPDDGRYCLVHLDCDLFAPTMSGLAYFYPRLVPGGFLIVHDYSSLCWNGAEKAVDEYFADKPEAPVLLPDSSGSVVIRRNRNPDEVSKEIMLRHAALLSMEWISAARGGLHDLLGQGWSAPEPWGVWGVGESHELRLTIPPHLPHHLRLQADVEAVLKGRRMTQRVEISVGEQTAAVWEFTPKRNRGARDVDIPLGDAAVLADGYRRVNVLFRPASTESPRSLVPELNDDRPLGMALHRMRYMP